MKIGSTAAMNAEPPTNPPEDEQHDNDEIVCRECGSLVYLLPDCEWPSDPRIQLCWHCMSWAYDAALKIIAAACTAEQDAEEQEE